MANKSTPPDPPASGGARSPEASRAAASPPASPPATAPASRHGPRRYLAGAVTSAVFAVVAWAVSRRLVAHFAAHPPHFSKPIAQSIAVALKTLLVGTSFLAFFSFCLIGVGLLLLLVRSLGSGQSESSTR